MAFTNIPLNTSLPLGQRVQNLARVLGQAMHEAEAVQAKAASMIDAEDHSLFETRTGCGTGAGVTLKGHIDTIQALLTTNAAQSNVATKLNQFVARLGDL